MAYKALCYLPLPPTHIHDLSDLPDFPLISLLQAPWSQHCSYNRSLSHHCTKCAPLLGIISQMARLIVPHFLLV